MFGCEPFSFRTTTHPVVRVTEHVGTSSSTESDADVVPEKRRRRGYHKPRPPRKRSPLAFIHLSQALQSESKKLQQVSTRGTVSQKLNGPKCVRLQTKPSHSCNLAAGHVIWQQRSPRKRLVGEDSTSLNSPQWVLTTFSKKGTNLDNEASGENDGSTDEDPTESKAETRKL